MIQNSIHLYFQFSSFHSSTFLIQLESFLTNFTKLNWLVRPFHLQLLIEILFIQTSPLIQPYNNIRRRYKKDIRNHDCQICHKLVEKIICIIVWLITFQCKIPVTAEPINSKFLPSLKSALFQM